MWLMDKLTISKEFNDYALEHWHLTCSKILRSKECDFLSVNKASFIVFSIRWLFQVADTLIKLENYEEALDVYNDVTLICTPNIPDYDCLKQALFCRNKSLEFLIKYGQNLESIEMSRNKIDLTFEEFAKYRENNSKSPVTPENNSKFANEATPRGTLKSVLSTFSSKKTSPEKFNSVLIKTPHAKKQSPPEYGSVIYVDSSDEDKPKAKPKKIQRPAATPSVTRSTRKATSGKSGVDMTPSTSTRTRRLN